MLPAKSPHKAPPAPDSLFQFIYEFFKAISLLNFGEDALAYGLQECPLRLPLRQF
ncbi:hypothetical protein V6Z11_D02G164600 [Gossypium hirsutum]